MIDLAGWCAVLFLGRAEQGRVEQGRGEEDLPNDAS